jgi:hypothetical protein
MSFVKMVHEVLFGIKDKEPKEVVEDKEIDEIVAEIDTEGEEE